MSKTFPTPYSALNSVLWDLVDSVQTVLSNNFVGAYLQGSFAVGDFDLHSDVDFIIVTEEELSQVEVQALQILHERIYCIDIPWAQHLEGSYFPREILRHYAHKDGQLWYLDHGSRALIQSDHCNTILVRWVVRENGVILVGPPPATLVNPIPVEMLRKEILATVHDWSQEIIAHPDAYNNRFYQTYIVLNYCRMVHDLYRGCPGSKLAGAEWAKANLDLAWTGLIDRAWDGRPNPAVSVRQQADPKDFKDTLEFIQYCSNKAQTLYRTIH
jgi:aminoglycoside adenylyltransferase-like protein/nucleotidyltransferase-like protein